MRKRAQDMESEKPSVVAYGRPITSPYGLLGDDENALTFALGYTLHECPQLLRWFLRTVGVSNVRQRALHSVQIELQRREPKSDDAGVTDIEIRLPGRFHVIVEAKVGLSLPTDDQCQRYLDRLGDQGEPIQRLVPLIQAPGVNLAERYFPTRPANHLRVRTLHWSALLSACVQLLESARRRPVAGRDTLQWFYTFLDREYPMKAFTTEVWILPAATKPLWRGGPSYLEIHQKHRIYFDNRTHGVRPLYIGFRALGKLDALHRVLRIEHGTPVSRYVPGLKAKWRDDPLTIWHLDFPVPLPRPIPTGARCGSDVRLAISTYCYDANRWRTSKR